MSTETIEGGKVASLAANEGVEQVELTEPWGAVGAVAESRHVAPARVAR